MTSYYTYCDSPLGKLLLLSDGTALTGLYLLGAKHCPKVPPGTEYSKSASPFPQAREQLSAYFSGVLKDFDLPLAPTGTAFQKEVWDQLSRIPYGVTVSYGEIGRAIGKPAASRAIGAANGRNPISIVVPCHRVIATTGALTGYAGGLENKRALLALEAGF